MQLFFPRLSISYIRWMTIYRSKLFDLCIVTPKTGFENEMVIEIWDSVEIQESFIARHQVTRQGYLHVEVEQWLARQGRKTASRQRVTPASHRRQSPTNAYKDSRGQNLDTSCQPDMKHAAAGTRRTDGETSRPPSLGCPSRTSHMLVTRRDSLL